MNNILEQSIRSLPPLPQSVAKVQEICNNPDAGVGTLTDVIKTDPMLTANLLKAANSPLYGFSREINNVVQAVSLFGMATVKGFALASAIKNTLAVDLSPYGISPDRFSELSQIHSSIMINWYGKVDNAALNVLSPAAFLIGVGKIVIANQLIKDKKDKEFIAKMQELQSAKKAEELFYGTNSAEVGAAIFDHWKFEADLVESIRYSLDYKNASENIQKYALALNVLIFACPFRTGLTQETIENAKKILKENNLSEAPFEKACSVILEAK